MQPPLWANLSIIKRIYENAEGAHVDHIIPLQGELVCGLHVENNLQYLTPEENSRKGNKLLEEFTTNNFS
jgi:5-methylcytosine-specific restriction endonuclease McrA